MHRLLVTSEILFSEHPALDAEAKHHLKVLRPKEGEEIELFDGAGHTRTVAYSTRSPLIPNSYFLIPNSSPVRTFPRPAKGLILFACITKGSRWDWTIEKAVELGVTEIVPVISQRVIVRLKPEERPAKTERWRRIAADAARQSDAVFLPKIHDALDFRDALALVAQTTCFVGALTNPPSPPILTALPSLASDLRPLTSDLIPNSYATFIGPEGDFTPEELEDLLKVAIPVSFGPTVLRAETAAIFALSILAAHINCLWEGRAPS